MKRLLMTAAAGLLMTTAAQAENKTVLYSGGYWSTSHIARNTGGHQSCVMSGRWQFASGATGTVMLKWQPNSGNVFWHIFKSNWRFVDGQEVPLAVALDAGTRKAVGTTFSGNNGSGGYIEIEIIPGHVNAILNDFATSDTMRIAFEHGNEPTWNANMTGSRAAKDWFVHCINKLSGNKPGSATSPVAPQATSPVPPQATSPVDPRAPAPSRPVQTQPIKKQLDGSV